MIIVTLTKLLVMRIVANVLSESSRNILILASLGFFSISNEAMSVGLKLKKAISDPLANADIINNKAVMIQTMITPMVGI